MRTSSSIFMIFFILASGSSWVLKSVLSGTSSRTSIIRGGSSLSPAMSTTYLGQWLVSAPVAPSRID